MANDEPARHRTRARGPWGASDRVDSVGTDTRAAPGQIRRACAEAPGHDFVATAAKAGGWPLVDAARVAAARPALPCWWWTPTPTARSGRHGGERRALHRLVAITGSNGKTSVKRCVAAIPAGPAETLRSRRARYPGNLNNDIGMPLTLPELREFTRRVVIEMGMNHPGEIGYPSAPSRAHRGLVNNAQRAHLQGMGRSTRSRAREGRDLRWPPGGGSVVVINADDRTPATGVRATPGGRL